MGCLVEEFKILKAFSKSGIPNPIKLLGFAKKLLLSIIAFFISQVLTLGKACIRQAAKPATKGEENEVPLPITIEPEAFCKITDCPWAATSGFIRPSDVGPLELKET